MGGFNKLFIAIVLVLHAINMYRTVRIINQSLSEKVYIDHVNSKVLRSKIQWLVVCRMIIATQNIAKKSNSEGCAEIGNCDYIPIHSLSHQPS